MAQKHVLVLGPLGVIGRTLFHHLTTLPDWTVTGLARTGAPSPDRGRFVYADLTKPAEVEHAVSGLRDVTHVFFAAYKELPTPSEQVSTNLTMLVHTVEAIESVATGLERIVLMEGVKAYGVHLGPFKTPAKESDPRHMPPNFYYDQEDYLREHQRGKRWNWTALRPDVVCGYAIGTPMNLVMVIAVYAAISKALGLPLRFPGKPGAYTALCQVTDSQLLAEATVWAATEQNCANEVINIANGDFIRWQTIWPTFAAAFEMDFALPQTISLSTVMRDKGALWDAIVAKHGLAAIPFESVALWPFGDFVFGCDYDVISDMTKARKLGFHHVVDSEQMFMRLFDQYRQNRIIP